MRLVLTKGEWWWVQCLCGGDSCMDNPTQKPFVFTPALMAVRGVVMSGAVSMRQR